MADSDPVETELKFLIEPREVPKLRAHPILHGAAREDELRSVYFDTPQGDLDAAGFSLRVRATGGVFVQTLKQRGSSFDFVRGEWECQLSSARPDLSVLAQTPAARLLGGDDVVLRSVFRTNVRRSSWLWRDGPDIVEISLDEGEVRSGDRRLRVRELELELKFGAPGALFSLARELMETVPLRVCFDSKAERGYRLARGEAPAAVGATTPEVRADMSVAETFRRIARACLAQTAANAEILRRVRRPEALHQMRVGLRRFRATLSAFRPMLDGPDFEALKAESKWLAHELDGARDEDVFMKSTFKAAADRAPGDAGFAAFGRRLIEVQAAAYDRALDAIRSPRASGLVLEACRWVEVGEWVRDPDPAMTQMREAETQAFATAALDHLLKTVRRRGRGLKDVGDEGRHQLRIKAKKLRYAAEFLAPVYGRSGRKQVRRFLSHLESMQDALGELNDIAVARRKALEDAGVDAPMAFAAGRAVGRRERGEAALISAAAAAAKDLRAAKPFWRS